MQGTIVMLMALSGLGCHHKGCDMVYTPSCYSGGCYGGCYDGCYATAYATVVEPSCYSACYSSGYSGCYGGCYGGGYGGCMAAVTAAAAMAAVTAAENTVDCSAACSVASAADMVAAVSSAGTIVVATMTAAGSTTVATRWPMGGATGLFSGGLRVEHADLRNPDEHWPGNDGLFDVFDAALRSGHASSRKAGCTGARHINAEHARSRLHHRRRHPRRPLRRPRLLRIRLPLRPPRPHPRRPGPESNRAGAWPDGQTKCRGIRRRRLGTFGGFSISNCGRVTNAVRRLTRLPLSRLVAYPDNVIYLSVRRRSGPFSCASSRRGRRGPAEFARCTRQCLITRRYPSRLLSLTRPLRPNHDGTPRADPRIAVRE